MKVLILTGRFGMGHVKAAEAIKEQLLADIPESDVDILDFIEYMFPKSTHIIYQTFNFMVRKCSGLYNMLNVFAGKNMTVPLKHMAVKRIDQMMMDYQPDCIIITFPVCSQYISKYKMSTGCKIPMYTFITDITAHEEWIATGTNHYFVGDLTTKNTLLSKGVPKGSITISGIPVRQKFYQHAIRTVGESKEILIMGGGLGLLPCAGQILEGLSKKSDVHVTVITGENQKLKRELMEKYPQMEILGLIEDVEVYMKRADLLVTKAGGVTTFEAIASNTPLYILKPFLEQEFGNAKYIEEHNIGRVLWNNLNQIDAWEDFLNLIEHPTLLMDMQKNMMYLKAQFDERGITLCS